MKKFTNLDTMHNQHMSRDNSPEHSSIENSHDGSGAMKSKHKTSFDGTESITDSLLMNEVMEETTNHMLHLQN
jgi:hypothetical protein